ncbi:hypothetical protein FOHLNKBM_0210 [Methylobacterium longum]|nr:hypothetical protein FOHLNKBM_0210 [Methylobacterium longum]
MPSSNPQPQPEVLAPVVLRGGLRGPRGGLDISFEARLRLAPQDEGVGRIRPPAFGPVYETIR